MTVVLHSSLDLLIQEDELAGQGYSLIAGVDEAGRGALAGPVVAAAVIFPSAVREQVREAELSGLAHALSGVRDSKELSPPVRRRLCPEIRARALAVGVGVVPHTLIDLYGISAAGRLAMCQAVRNLGVRPDFLLIDAFRLSNLRIPQRGVIRGDQTCFSIAAASIVAKVTRDEMMVRWSDRYPDYGFAAHKGYGTDLHLDALTRCGPCPLHRRSFRPIKEA